MLDVVRHYLSELFTSVTDTGRPTHEVGEPSGAGRCTFAIEPNDDPANGFTVDGDFEKGSLGWGSVGAGIRFCGRRFFGYGLGEVKRV